MNRVYSKTVYLKKKQPKQDKKQNKTKINNNNRAYNVNLNVYLGVGSQWIALDKL